MTPSGTQLGTDVRGPRALYFGDIYQDASSISHTVVFHTRLRFLGIPPNILLSTYILIYIIYVYQICIYNAYIIQLFLKADEDSSIRNTNIQGT